MRRLTSFGFTALAVGLTFGCAGGQTGDLSGQNGGQETGNASGGCDEHKQPLDSFDQMTEAGSAEQLLTYAERSFDAPLTWKKAGDGQSWQVGPESGEGQLHVDVVRGRSAYLLTYTPHEQSGAGATIDIGTVCPPTQLGVEAHVDVTTDGGALAESYDTLLRSTTLGVATLSVPFDPTKVKGTLVVSSSNPQAKLVQLSLDATLMAEGMTGRIAGLEQVQSGSGPSSAVSAASAVLAVWPDSAACQAFFQDGGGLGLPTTADALGFSGEQTLASLTPAQPAPITWLNGDSTTLSVSIEATGDGCFRVRDDLPVELGGGPSVTYPVTIKLESADGKLDGIYAGKVVATGSGGARSVIADATLNLAVDQVEQSGFASVSVPTGADGLLLRVETRLEAGSAVGSVRLLELTNPPCLTETPAPTPTPGGGSSSPGCAGQTQTPLESASW